MCYIEVGEDEEINTVNKAIFVASRAKQLSNEER